MNIPENGVSLRSVRYFFTPSSFAEELFYYPTRIGHYYCDRNYHFSYQCAIAAQPSHHFNFMLFFVKQGLLDIHLQEQHYTAERNHIVLFDCRRPHEYHALSDDLEFYWLLFNGAQSGQYYSKIIEMHQGNQVFRAGDSTQLQLLFTRLLNYGEAATRVPEHSCSELIYSLLCQLLAVSDEMDNETELYINRALSFMDLHFDTALTVETVASHIGLSASYFTKQFRQRTGYTPYEYITLCRIGRAKELLLNSNYTVKQIAYETGYNSEENFIRAFKKKVGAAPTTFRQYPI